MLHARGCIKPVFIVILLASFSTLFADSDRKSVDTDEHKHHSHIAANQVQVGTRPYFLVEDMDPSKLKTALQKCQIQNFKKSDFSIGHRGASLQFPEHTKESYMAGIRMGAGILECDVTFTSDKELVCRHSQCDLHATTNILAITELAKKCSVPFIPADPSSGTPAQAKCCTSDITLEEFKTLKGKMDAFNPMATTVEAYMNATPNWRTDLYSGPGSIMSHAESIALFKKMGVKMTPELKSPSVTMPYKGTYTQQDYAKQMVESYINAGVDAKDVFMQSFNIEDIYYWIEHYPEFGKQAVYLDGRYDDPKFDHTDPSTWSPSMHELSSKGVRIIAPPMWMLVRVDAKGKIVPSDYALAAKAAGLKIITWTLERSGLLKDGGGWYYQTISDAVDNDGDVYELLDVLAKDVGIIGIFSDWPATVTYYANCKGIK